MENRCRLDIVGITYSQIERGVYAIILQQANSKRRLPIIIGTSEAQSIECRLQNIKTPRPLTHDLMIKSLERFGVTVNEVFIHRLPNGVFTADLTLTNGEKEITLDSRSSDAIALALRSGAPIFTSQEVLDEAGFDTEESSPSRKKRSEGSYETLSEIELQEILKDAVDNERYEEASKIKAEIDRRQSSDKSE